MADAQGNKTGGRSPGTPNKASKAVKEFLERVFSRAFTEKRTITVSTDGGRTFVPVELSLEDRLVDEIIRGNVDPGQFKTLLAYYAGQPRQAFDHTHTGKVTLEQIIAGTANASADQEDV